VVYNGVNAGTGAGGGTLTIIGNPNDVQFLSGGSLYVDNDFDSDTYGDVIINGTADSARTVATTWHDDTVTMSADVAVLQTLGGDDTSNNKYTQKLFLPVFSVDLSAAVWLG
jgi:hypothetical protein